eukprot:3040979-Amphidinium_carterae.1
MENKVPETEQVANQVGMSGCWRLIVLKCSSSSFSSFGHTTLGCAHSCSGRNGIWYSCERSAAQPSHR